MSIGEQVDTRSATGKMMLNLLAVVSQWERQVIGELASAALHHLKSQGVKLGQRPLTGPAVARAQELRRQGFTLQAIASALTAEGYATKRGGRWQHQTVRLLLERA